MECPQHKFCPLFISTLEIPVLRSCGNMPKNLALGYGAGSGLICAAGSQRRIVAGSVTAVFWEVKSRL